MFKTFIQELRKKHRTNAQISDKFRNLAKICPNKDARGIGQGQLVKKIPLGRLQ